MPKPFALILSNPSYGVFWNFAMRTVMPTVPLLTAVLAASFAPRALAVIFEVGAYTVDGGYLHNVPLRSTVNMTVTARCDWDQVPSASGSPRRVALAVAASDSDREDWISFGEFSAARLDKPVQVNGVRQEQNAVVGPFTFDAAFVPGALTGGNNSSRYMDVRVIDVASGDANVGRRLLYVSDDCPTPGQYGFGTDCKDCPAGGICPGGDRIIPAPGFYLNDNGKPVPCGASGSGETCIEPCNEGYTGKLCAECKELWHRDENNICRKGDASSTDRLGATVTVAAAWSVVAAVLLVPS